MKKLFGGILLALGILIAGASGLCSAFFFLSSVASPSSMGDMILLILLIGGIPFLIGIGLIFGGRALIRAANEQDGYN